MVWKKKSATPEVADRDKRQADLAAESPYFPVRVRLSRNDVMRLTVALDSVETIFKQRGMNTDRDLAQIAATLKHNVDSALKFSDQNFILITQEEYDELTAKRA